MPIYEFKCPNCGQEITELCRMGETGEGLVCLACDNKGLRKLISSFASPTVSEGACFSGGHGDFAGGGCGAGPGGCAFAGSCAGRH